MHILVLSFVNGDVNYVGPFPSEYRASLYAASAVLSYGDKLARWFVKPLIVPHTVVFQVLWRPE